MPTLQETREQRANVWSQMTEIMDRATREGRDMTAEETTTYDRAEADVDRLGDIIARQERHENRQREMTAPDRAELRPAPAPLDAAGDDDPAYTRAFESYMRFGMNRMDRADLDVLARGWCQPENAAGVGTGGAGGYTVPPAFRNQIIEQLRDFGAVRRVAEHIETTTGANLPWPTVDDTGNIGAIVGENTQITEQDVTFGTASLDAYMYTSKIVRASLQLLQDTGFDFEKWLSGAFARRIGRIQNQHFTTGTGTGQPDGIVTSALVAKQGAAGQTTSVTYDDMVDVIDSIDTAYLTADGLQWMFSQAVRKIARKIKDAQGRPMWEPSLQAGTPDTLLGYGYVLNNDMPAPAAGAKSMLFGDFAAGYVIRDVTDVVVQRLTERYAEYGQVGFVALQRSDGTQQNASAYKAYQHSAA